MWNHYLFKSIQIYQIYLKSITIAQFWPGVVRFPPKKVAACHGIGGVDVCGCHLDRIVARFPIRRKLPQLPSGKSTYSYGVQWCSMVFNGVQWGLKNDLPSGYVNQQFAIENGHRNSWFTHLPIYIGYIYTHTSIMWETQWHQLTMTGDGVYPLIHNASGLTLVDFFEYLICEPLRSMLEDVVPIWGFLNALYISDLFLSAHKRRTSMSRCQNLFHSPSSK